MKLKNFMKKNKKIICIDIDNTICKTLNKYENLNRIKKIQFINNLYYRGVVCPHFSSNVQGTFNVLKASQENKVKDFYTQLPRPVMEYQKIIQLLKMKKFHKISICTNKKIRRGTGLHFAEIYKLNATYYVLMFMEKELNNWNLRCCFRGISSTKNVNKPFTIVEMGSKKRFNSCFRYSKRSY